MWVNPGEIAGNGIDDDGNGSALPLRVNSRHAIERQQCVGLRAPRKSQRALLFTRILHGFGVDDQAAAPVLSPQPTPTACGRARLTSQVQLLAPRLKGQVIEDPEPGPFR
jgi:hypothetical protein